MPENDLPPALTREYLETRRRAILMELRTVERLLRSGRTPTAQQAQRDARRVGRDRVSEEGRHGHE